MAEPQTSDEFIPHPVSEFRGEYTLPNNAQKVPHPYSPSATNVAFLPGKVFSRPGLTSVATLSAAVLSIKDYTLLDVSQKRTLALTSDGVLSKESGGYAYSSIATELVAASVATSLQMSSATIFGREYMAFGANGLSGVSVPRAYNDTNLDRVAPGGPAGACTLAGGGAGTITAGTRSCRVLFRTRNGFITAPGPSVSFTFAGSTTCAVTVIPIGPAYVVGRILAFTPYCSTDYYYIAGSAMDIRDNTSATATVDFLDSALLAGTPVSIAADRTNDMLRLIQLPQQASVTSYHDRLAWIGELNSLTLNGDTGFRNLSFDGGFNAGATLPLGWTQRYGGVSKAAPGVTGTVGDGIKITGDGANTKGQLECTANASAAIPAGVEIRARVRMKKSASAGTTATFNIYIVDTSAGDAIAGGQIVASSLSSSEWRWIDVQVLSAASNLPTSTSRLRISTGGTQGGGTAIPNSEWLAVDDIELYPGNAAYSPALVRWSRAFQADAYDGLYGIQTYAENNGERATCGFVLGDNYYVCKERSLFVTHDDGANEPAFWSTSQISSVYGTPSTKGVGIGDQWVVIAGRAGLAFFAGGRPTSLTDDIRATWNRINWTPAVAAGIWVTVDTQRRRIEVGVPLDGAVVPSTIIVLDYYGENPLANHDFNRWNFGDNTALCSCFSERSDGTRAKLYGTNHAAGLVCKLDDTAHSDFAPAQAKVAINSRYRMAYNAEASGRQLFGKLTGNFAGSGTLSVTGYLPDNLTTTSPTVRGPASITLQNPFDNDVEWPAIDVTTERISWEVATNATDDWWSMQHFCAYYKQKPWTPLRGTRGA